MTEPAILLADEPTGNLDSRTSAEIMALFHRFWQERGQTILLITHDIEVAAWADRTILLRDGKIGQDIRPEGSKRDRALTIRELLEEATQHV